MLWFLLTAYLCVGCYRAGIVSGVEGGGVPIKALLLEILAWPRYYIPWDK